MMMSDEASPAVQTQVSVLMSATGRIESKMHGVRWRVWDRGNSCQTAMLSRHLLRLVVHMR
jgi:hypothetical protein